MVGMLAGSHRSATLSAAGQSCWWQYMSMASLGLAALTNSSSASPNLPVSQQLNIGCASAAGLKAAHGSGGTVVMKLTTHMVITE